jgi:hypothetical protein
MKKKRSSMVSWIYWTGHREVHDGGSPAADGRWHALPTCPLGLDMAAECHLHHHIHLPFVDTSPLVDVRHGHIHQVHELASSHLSPHHTGRTLASHHRTMRHRRRARSTGTRHRAWGASHCSCTRRTWWIMCWPRSQGGIFYYDTLNMWLLPISTPKEGFSKMDVSKWVGEKAFVIHLVLSCS